MGLLALCAIFHLPGVFQLKLLGSLQSAPALFQSHRRLGTVHTAPIILRIGAAIGNHRSIFPVQGDAPGQGGRQTMKGDVKIKPDLIAAPADLGSVQLHAFPFQQQLVDKGLGQLQGLAVTHLGHRGSKPRLLRGIVPIIQPVFHHLPLRGGFHRQPQLIQAPVEHPQRHPFVGLILAVETGVLIADPEKGLDLPGDLLGLLIPLFRCSQSAGGHPQQKRHCHDPRHDPFHVPSSPFVF